MNVNTLGKTEKVICVVKFVQKKITALQKDNSELESLTWTDDWAKLSWIGKGSSGTEASRSSIVDRPRAQTLTGFSTPQHSLEYAVSWLPHLGYEVEQTCHVLTKQELN